MIRIYDPCTAAEAVSRMRALAATKTGQYVYGAGNYLRGSATPWTTRKDEKTGEVLYGGDCRVAFLHGWKVAATEPGYNRAAGPKATVVDDVNYNSMIEDGEAARELIAQTYRSPQKEMPRLGDFIAYPTFYLPHHPDPWIGHGAGIVGIPDDYVPGEGWHRLTLAQCHGPQKFAPGFVLTDGALFDHHDMTWPLEQHRTVLLRPRERS